MCGERRINMEKFVKPEFEAVVFENEDVIQVSNFNYDDDETQII